MRDLLVSFGSLCFWYGVKLWFLWLCLAIVLDSLGNVSQRIEDSRGLILTLARVIWQLPLSLGLLLFIATLYMD
ncbi:hypothetical protein ACFPTX_16310 [Pseudomonas sp. GCM10022188]|uniref:hypothetical protein n=1 Tax=Pseudomonas TaxID=286 RepID=UPI001E4DCD4D|nr:hypothetical protein [Pseudomonas oryzagri]MCC6076089.1 hypothetical protein [Pseudomonas oryzagri]